MRVESVTSSLRGLSLSVGLSLSSSSASIICASLSRSSGRGVTHRLLRLAEWPIQASHGHREIIALELGDPVRRGKALHLRGILGEPLHKGVHRNARLERLIPQLREDARRVAHAQLRQPGVDVRQLLVEAVHLALGASKAGHPGLHGVGELGAVDVVRGVGEELHRGRQVADAADEFAAVEALERGVERVEPGGTGLHPLKRGGGDLQLGTLRGEVIDHGPGDL